jgi:hypothetical protein
MPAGRPTEYSLGTLEKAREYLEAAQDEEVQVVKQANPEKGYEMFDHRLKVNSLLLKGWPAI